MPLVSIIVPVYNADKFLKGTLDSLVCQTIESYEVICIDNGSTDGSGLLLEEYAIKYPDIIRIYKILQNSGEWPARILGIKEAYGEFIGFCDSDDCVHPDMYKELYDTIKKSDADLSICAFHRVSSKSGEIYTTEMAGFGNKTVHIENDYGSIALITPAWWNKLYKKAVVEKTLSYNNLPRLAPDVFFFITILPFIKIISYIDRPLYYYMVHSASVTNNSSVLLVDEVKQRIAELKKTIIEDTGNAHLLELIDLLAFVHFGVALLLSLSKSKNINIRYEAKKTVEYLDTNFTTWRHSKYLTLSYIRKHNKALFKVCIARFFLKYGLMPEFLKCYKYLTSLIKTDIKW